MIRHICMFKFKEEADGRTKSENVNIAKQMLDNLPQSISYILHSEITSFAMR